MLSPTQGEVILLGLIARTSSPVDGIVLGYFFGSRFDECPDLERTTGLTPVEAILVARFGHLGLLSGRWQLLGRNGAWQRDRWPMPTFGRRTSLGETYKVAYSDIDALRSMNTTKVPAAEIEGLPHDGLAGAEFIEKRLARLARPSSE